MSPAISGGEIPVRICEECAKHDAVRGLIRDRGELGHSCTLCGWPHRTIDASMPAFVQLVKALVRYFFPESAYNVHHGGDGLERLLQDENPILMHGNSEGIEELSSIVFDKGYESYTEGVTLFAGYFDGEQLPLLRALKDDDAPLIVRLRDDLRRVNHFVVERPTIEVLRPLADGMRREIPVGEVYYRARIGIASRFLFGEDLEREGLVPLQGSEIGAPPPTKASAGRANRQGVSFLYLASTIDTALAEVRPHPGHAVSIGTFATARALNVAKFDEISISAYSSCDAKLEEFLVLQSIDRELSEPITPEERDKYVLGQLIADVCRQLGFDGVQYRSSVAKGHNLCIFDSTALALRVEEARALRVDSVSFSATALEAFVAPPDDHYPLRKR